MSDNFTVGTTIALRPAVVVDRSGTVITGSTTLTVEIERGADGFFWDWNDSTFKNAGWTTKAGALAAVSDANAPGWYQRVGGWNSTSQSAGFYWVTYRDTASAAGNMPQSEELYLGGTAAGVADVQTRLPAALVGGRIDASVGALGAGSISAATFAAGAIDAAAIATGAIDADALAADAVAEIQAGLATPTNITAGTITTVTNLTNAPTVGDFTATMKTSITTAATAATPTVTVGAMGADTITAASLAASAVTEIQSGLAVPGSAMTLADDAITSATIAEGAIGASEAPLLANLDAAVSSRASAANLTTTQADITTLLTRVDVASSTLATAAALTAVATDTTKTRRALYNRRSLSSLGLFSLYADDAVTVLYTATVTDVTGSAVTVAAGDAARTTALV